MLQSLDQQTQHISREHMWNQTADIQQTATKCLMLQSLDQQTQHVSREHMWNQTADIQTAAKYRRVKRDTLPDGRRQHLTGVGGNIRQEIEATLDESESQHFWEWAAQHFQAVVGNTSYEWAAQHFLAERQHVLAVVGNTSRQSEPLPGS